MIRINYATSCSAASENNVKWFYLGCGVWFLIEIGALVFLLHLNP